MSQTGALLKGILEFPGVLAVAVVAGWGIGAVLWQARAHPLLAALVAGGAWLLGLALTWLVSMAILPGSSRSFLERLEATPFLEWQQPQFGAIEVLSLLFYVVAALYGARPRRA
jgi:ribose/xylose/arabinose/galactoside ABC-type transport system permease subunit